MAALLFGALAVKATDIRRLPEEAGGGGLRRTLNGSLRGRTDWSKRGWSGTAYAADDAALAALLAVADPDTDVTISGDLIGASLTARVTTGEAQYVRTGSTWYYLVPFTARES